MALLSMVVSLTAQAADFATSSEGHSHQPGGWLDYAISGVGAVIVAIVIFYAVRYFVDPRETESNHIKRMVLEEPV